MKTRIVLLVLACIPAFGALAQVGDEIRKRKRTQPSRETQDNRNRTAPQREPSAYGAAVTGQIFDKSDDWPLQNATFVLYDLITEKPVAGAITDLNGEFKIKRAPAGTYLARVSFLGYKGFEKEIEIGKNETVDFGRIDLEKDEIGIDEIEVLATTAIEGVTPVATTHIDELEIKERYTTAEDFPSVAEFSPSVYVSRAGGGFGDSRISIRGFEQENLAILLNGVPVNDMEFGNIFWVNWMGLNDVSRRVEIQRGMGVSRLAINSVGGTMNIITHTTDVESGGAVTYETTHATQRNGAYLRPVMNKVAFEVHTGMSEDGWAVSAQGSRVTGPGYVDQLYIDFWSYFLSISKQIGDDHLLVFTGLGAPQEHGERQTPSTIATYDRYGETYNPDWGYQDGEPTGGRNFYHKPQFMLNHYWTITDRTRLNSSAYYSSGTGGGGFTPFGPRREFDGALDFGLMRELNRTGLDTVVSSAGDTAVGYQSEFTRVNFRLDQYWIGALSTLTHDFDKNLQFLGGVDLRHYNGRQFFELDDLVGGDFAVDDSDIREPVKVVREGDRIWQSKTGIISWGGLFGQIKYQPGPWTLFASASASANRYQRRDDFLYLEENELSDPEWIPTYSLKGGANYRINDVFYTYASGGYFERAPFFGNVFPFNNEVTNNITAEKVTSAEIGFGAQTKNFRGLIDVYFTRFSDKTVNLERGQDDQGNEISAIIDGLRADHMGVEFELYYQPSRWLQLGAFFSQGDWQWTSDVEAVVSDFTRTNFDTVSIYADGLRIGGAPQTSLGLSGTIRPGARFYATIDFFYYANMYADLDVTQRDDPDNRKQPWKTPDFTNVELHTGYNFMMGRNNANLRLSVLNLFDTSFINQAQDGANSDRATALVFYGFGRNITLGLTYNF